jgi:DNA-directed RNA polymerase subunit RPC12/RpoP
MEKKTNKKCICGGALYFFTEKTSEKGREVLEEYLECDSCGNKRFIKKKFEKPHDKNQEYDEW